MKPPNKGLRSSKYYQGYIDAKVPAKENSIRKQNENSHFYAARVRYALELASKFQEVAIVYSVDNKNKILLGSQVAAVDRCIQINRFFPTDDSPNLPDHDFPTPGYFVPCGYLQMVSPNLNDTDQRWSRKGPVSVSQSSFNVSIFF